MVDVTDMIHKGTRASISHEFSALYKTEWHKARDSLRPTKSDEEIIYVLLRIVRVSDFILCLYYFYIDKYCRYKFSYVIYQGTNG